MTAVERLNQWHSQGEREVEMENLVGQWQVTVESLGFDGPRVKVRSEGLELERVAADAIRLLEGGRRRDPGRVNRQQRRQSERDGARPKPAATPEDAKRFIDEAFGNRISWVAARTILVRVTDDVAWSQLDPALRESITTFLARHPAPPVQA